MRSVFGWSYPPGAANDPNAPYNQVDGPCAVCGMLEDNCICPECPKCKAIGDPFCYDGGKRYSFDKRRNRSYSRKKPGHGMVRSPEQITSRAKIDALRKAEADFENAAYAKEMADEAAFLKRNPPRPIEEDTNG